MPEDDRDFLQRANSMTGNLYGEPTSVDSIAENFSLYGLNKRSAALERFDKELRGEIDSGAHSLRRHVRLVAMRRKMADAHQALRKAKR